MLWEKTGRAVFAYLIQDEIISFLDALFCLFGFEIIEPLGFDYCYNCAKMKGQKTFVL